MGIIGILIVVVIAGVCVYLVNQFVPLPRPFKVVFNVIVALSLILWLLWAFGLISGRTFQTRGCDAPLTHHRHR
jgi:cytochrome c biogenesis protein CcdA